MRGYFDANATTPMWEEAVSVWQQAVQEWWGNPSALYTLGSNAKARLEQAREKIATLRGVQPEQVVFTSGATESNNAILRSWLERPGKGVVSVAEHPSVSWTLQEAGEQVENWPVKDNGQVSLNWFRQRLKQGKPPEWVALQSVNNETGVIQPLREVLKLLEGTQVRLLCDASQQWGKLDTGLLSPRVWEVSSAHKFGGPKGVGWLILGDPEERAEIQRGGAQEHGLRAGTENLAAILAMVTAVECIEQWWAKGNLQKSHTEREALERVLLDRIPGIQIAGAKASRVWNTTMLIMPRHENHRWVTRMNRKGFSFGTGAACSTGKLKGSAGLRAMGFSRDERSRALRISAGWWTRAEDWQALAESLVETWRELEAESRESNVIVIP